MNRSRKATARRSRKATAGKIMPPIDVTSMKDLKEMWKRIRIGPATVFLVYAPWCGHCHKLMPHFDEAAKSPGRTVQVVKVNDTMLPAANAYLRQNSMAAKPIEVDGYPTVMLLKKNGAEAIPMNPVNDTARMTRMMNEAGTAAEEEPVAPSMNNAVRRQPPAAVNQRANNTFNLDEPTEDTNVLTSEEGAALEEEAAEEGAEEAAEGANNTDVQPIAPPTSEDKAEQQPIAAMGGGRRSQGGSLLASMSAAAYQLAPAAVLLGLQTAMGRDRRSANGKDRKSVRGGKDRRSAHGKRTVKRKARGRRANRTAKRNNKK